MRRTHAGRDVGPTDTARRTGPNASPTPRPPTFAASCSEGEACPPTRDCSARNALPCSGRARLPGSPAGAERPDGTRGRRGPEPAPWEPRGQVRVLESRLHRFGMLASSAVDGRYRAATVNAVEAFQRLRHVRVTGRVKKRVWNMNAARYPPAGPPRSGAEDHRPPGGGPARRRRTRWRPCATPHGWVDVLEFDLRLTADREIVLMHDMTLDRTTNCTGASRRWTWGPARPVHGGRSADPDLRRGGGVRRVGAGPSPRSSRTRIRRPTSQGRRRHRPAHGMADRPACSRSRQQVLARVHNVRPALDRCSSPGRRRRCRRRGRWSGPVAIAIVNLTIPRCGSTTQRATGLGLDGAQPGRT